MKTKLLFSSIAIFLCSLGSIGQTVLSVTGTSVGGWGTDSDMTTTDGVTYTLVNKTFTAGLVKFREAHDWAVAYGFTPASAPGFPTGVGINNGTNIPVPAGTYNVTFNLTTKEYSFTPGVSVYPVINLIGTAVTPDGNIDVAMTTNDGISYNKESYTFAVGKAKFRKDSNWTTNWSSATFPSGTGVQGGVDIDVAAGTYNVNFNYTSGAYTFTPVVVGIIGSATPGIWATDTNMTTTDNVTYTLNNITLVTGALKFRDNGSWNFNYGAASATSFPSGTGVFDSATDIPVTAGTYNITFNRSTLAYNFQNVALAVNNFEKSNFEIYPNPTYNIWNFTSANEEIKSIQIVNVLGKTVLSKNTLARNAVLDASSLSKGIYFAKITTETSQGTIQLIKN
jgi:starch-binding outer membrane protein SusE/F